MAITTAFDSEKPINTCLDILKQHLETFFDGNIHDGVQFPDAEIYLEQRELEPPFNKANIRIKIPSGSQLGIVNGIDEKRTVRQRFEAEISVILSRDTYGTGLGELFASDIKDLIRSLMFHKYVSFLETAGLSEFDTELPVDIPHSQLWMWSMTVTFVVDVAQTLISP